MLALSPYTGFNVRNALPTELFYENVAGIYSYTFPFIGRYLLYVIGGGGGGAGTDSTASSVLYKGGSGGGGILLDINVTSLSPTKTVTITVGSGGTGGNGGVGHDGQQSEILIAASGTIDHIDNYSQSGGAIGTGLTGGKGGNGLVSLVQIAPGDSLAITINSTTPILGGDTITSYGGSTTTASGGAPGIGGSCLSGLCPILIVASGGGGGGGAGWYMHGGNGGDALEGGNSAFQQNTTPTWPYYGGGGGGGSDNGCYATDGISHNCFNYPAGIGAQGADGAVLIIGYSP